MNLSKEYIGKIRLGLETDTDDVTGKIISRSAIPQLSLDELNRTCQAFIGEIPQVPPIFSAKKMSGRRLYTFARQGETIEIPPKKVIIHALEILELKLPFIKIKVTCSKGTYIRSIARDLGKKLMVGAYLHSLTRTRIGDYSISDALTVVQFEKIVKSKGN